VPTAKGMEDAVGVLGGTFDPVHNAHLAMARAALAHLPVKKVLFMPTGNPPYRGPPVASPVDRVAMLKLAVEGNADFAVDERELAPGASGYTADTLKALHAEFPGQQIFLLMGSDQHGKLASWRRPDEVARLAQIAVFSRPGSPIKGKDVKIIPFEPTKESASEIRARAGRGESLAGMVPPAVADYIARRGLYRGRHA